MFILYFCLTIIALYTIDKIFFKNAYKLKLILQLKNKSNTVYRRILIYFLIPLLNYMLPKLLAVLIVIYTDNGKAGMVYGLFLGLFISQIIITNLFLKLNIFLKFIISFVMYIFVMAITIINSDYEVVKTNLDYYGYYDILIVNSIATIIVWELYFRIEKLVKSKKQFTT